MKRVLFVIETLRGGGAERALSNIVTHFPDGWNIDILINDKTLIEYPYRGNILTLSSPEKKSPLYFIKNVIIRILYLIKIKKRNKYDACVSFLEGPNISNIISGNKYCKTIVSIRNHIMDEHSSFLIRIMEFLLVKCVYCHADTVVAVSEEITMELVHQLKISESKVKTIVNGVDCKDIRERMTRQPQNKICETLLMQKECKIVVNVGRMVEPKGQWHLIRAFSDVIKREPKAILLIIGDGELKGYFEELIEAYGLYRKVFLVGRTDNPFWFYANADCFVLSSLSEGYPNALAEAVCCGTPCISTDVHSGSREILAPRLKVMGERVEAVSEEEYGILVPVCSGKMYRNCEALEPEEKKLANAIGMLLEDREKRAYYREKSMERSKDLDLNPIVNKWVDAILM